MSWPIELLAVFIQSLFILILGLILGHKVFKIFKNESVNNYILYLATGWGVLAYSIYLMGELKVLRPLFVIILLLILYLWCYKELFLLFKRIRIGISWQKLDFSNLEIMILMLILIFIIMYLVVSLAPAIKFDGLWYHLTEAKVYLQEGRIREFLPPAQLGQSSVTPRLVEMLYTVMLSFNQSVSVGAKLIHFWLGIGSVVGIYGLGKSIFNRRTGLIAALMLVSIPVVGWLFQTAYIDLGVIFYGIAALWAYRIWCEDKMNSLVFGLTLAFFLATKLWVLLFVPVLIADAIIRGINYRKIIKMLLVTLLFISPWFIEAYIRTGNPVYPVFSSQTDLEHLGGASSIRDWLGRVYWETLWTAISTVVTRSIPWLCSLVMVFLFPKHLRGKRLNLLIVGLGLFFLWSIIPIRDSRYLIVFTVPLIMLVASYYDLALKTKLVSVAILLPSSLLLFFLFLAPLQRVFFYAPVVFGHESRSHFLQENIDKNIWGCLSQDNEVRSILGSNNKVLVFCHNMFYLDKNFIDGFDILSRNNIKNKDGLLTLLKENNFSYVYTKAPAYSLSNVYNVSGINEDINSEWTKEHFKMVYTSNTNNITLYEIKY